MKKIIIIAISLLFIVGCGNGQVSEKIEKGKDFSANKDQYNWSTMNEGPYKDKISFAASQDLANWQESGVTLAEHASVPGAVIKDGKIYLYFVDVSEDGVAERLGLIISEDNGQTWSEKRFVEIKGLEERVAVDPAPFLTDANKIRLYYFDIEATRTGSKEEENYIYSAISSDGIEFIQEDGYRFKKANIFDPDVIKVGAEYRMYVGDVEGNRVLSAKSYDGLNFSYEGVAFIGGAVPDVFYKNGEYYLYTAGIDVSKGSDGKSFKKTDSFFHAESGEITADPSVIEVGDNNYLMFFKYK